MKEFDDFYKKSAIIDLDKKSVTVHSNKSFFPLYLGGKGLAQRILFNEIKKGTHPLGPENVLILSAGPLSGTDVPCSCRHTFDTMSPITGGVGSSNSCGFIASELKFAGFNQIILKGRSETQVIVAIHDEDISIIDASHLTGKGTRETEDIIRSDLGDGKIQVASIGPAGESVVHYASIMANKTRAAAKCGAGAVMGSKNVKAIAIRGHGSISIAHFDLFEEYCKKAKEKILGTPGLMELKERGFATFMKTKNDLSSLAFRNFQECYVDLSKEEYKSIIPEQYHQYITQRRGFFNCLIKCDKKYSVNGMACESLEANSITNFACKLGIRSPTEVMRLHMLCDDLGMDEDSTAGTIAWAMECFEKGLLTEQDVGMRLEWDDADAVSRLMQMIAHREGIGDVLSHGSWKSSQMLGTGEQYAMHVKGQDLYEHMRAMKGWALGVAISTRGGGHTSGAPMTEFMNLSEETGLKKWGIPSAGDPLSYDGKADLVIYYERLHAVVNSLGVCLFISDWEDPQLLDFGDFAQLLSSASGVPMSKNDLITTGERIINVEKAFNTFHAGFTRKDDCPPDRFFDEPIPSGPLKGERLHRDRWNAMLDRYYQLHGWEKTGRQTRESLDALGLENVSETLEDAHLIETRSIL